ncbi:hypothetical protein [Mangrovicoccus ximenensis]|nr:hypothetical protein [Mangrovicoccus ximenensis]
MKAGQDIAQGAAAHKELERLSRLDPDRSWPRAAVIARCILCQGG